MSDRPQLHLVDTATGEVVEDERDLLIDQLTRDLHGKQVQMSKLRREIAELRVVEPGAEVIRDVLDYWCERFSPNAVIAPGGKRWEKVRARLGEPLLERVPWTPAELKLAVDGALTDRWMMAEGYRHRRDAVMIFRDSEMVEKLRDLAIGFEAKAGLALRDLIDVGAELHVVSWKFLLCRCECDHRRIEHARGDPDHSGQERCFLCACQDFFEDPFDRLGA